MYFTIQLWKKQNSSQVCLYNDYTLMKNKNVVKKWDRDRFFFSIINHLVCKQIKIFVTPIHP